LVWFWFKSWFVHLLPPRGPGPHCKRFLTGCC
jgi:hypothetical protein